MTTTIAVTHPAAGSATVPLSYLPHARRRGWTEDGPADVAPEHTAVPNRSASKGDWVAYAVDVGGMATEESEAATRADLADLFVPADHDG